MCTVTPERSKEYVEDHGLTCPFCGDEGGIEGFFVNIDTGWAYQNVRCIECGAEWTDVYQLHHIEERR